MTKALQCFTRSDDRAVRAQRNQLILPEPIEAVGAKLGISHHVHDIAVTQEVLQRAGVDAIVGELEAAAHGAADEPGKEVWPILRSGA